MEPVDPVVQEFKQWLKPEIAIPVAAIKALTSVLKRSEASTMMELEVQLKAAADSLKRCETIALDGRTSISLTAGCELFLRYVTRCFLDFPDFDVCKTQLIERGELFAEESLKSRVKIAELGHMFIQDGQVILTHGHSRVVSKLILKAAESRNFTVIVTEGRPDGAGYTTAKEMKEAGIPVTVILDSAIGYVMEKVGLVIVGAEGVVENGGIVNKVGTYQLAIVAKALNKPFYVASESYKFARLFPLNQSELPESESDQMPLIPPNGQVLPPNVKVDNPSCDYTPPSYITLLFTDLGVLTPSAVSDELIKLYQ
jgi:translation initiation factor eIF-2B subunit alpha